MRLRLSIRTKLAASIIVTMVVVVSAIVYAGARRELKNATEILEQQIASRAQAGTSGAGASSPQGSAAGDAPDSEPEAISVPSGRNAARWMRTSCSGAASSTGAAGRGRSNGSVTAAERTGTLATVPARFDAVR